MKLTYIYRIKPSTEQVAIMETWLEMLRRHFNYALGQRFDFPYLSQSQSMLAKRGEAQLTVP
jgi:putative transposase